MLKGGCMKKLDQKKLFSTYLTFWYISHLIQPSHSAPVLESWHKGVFTPDSPPLWAEASWLVCPDAFSFYWKLFWFCWFWIFLFLLYKGALIEARRKAVFDMCIMKLTHIQRHVQHIYLLCNPVRACAASPVSGCSPYWTLCLWCSCNLASSCKAQVVPPLRNRVIKTQWIISVLWAMLDKLFHLWNKRTTFMTSWLLWWFTKQKLKQIQSK